MADEDDEDAARRARAESRRARMVLGLEDDELTPDQRVELVEVLTRAAWAMSGQPWPSLPRSRWPVRIRRLGEPA
jgi:hypothetical protein